jgi:hypothetical protein
MNKKISNLILYIYQIYTLMRYAIFIDSKSPRKGYINDKGYFESKLNNKELLMLKKYFLVKYSKNNKKKFGGIDLSFELFEPIISVFDIIKDDVLKYMGPAAKLDGISLSFSDLSDSDKSISALWHTDNVGMRLKCFVCLEGDGSQPTVLLPSKVKNDILRILLNAFIQIPRWIGLKNKIIHPKEVYAYHKSGSIIIFDTDILHRGGYEKAETNRIILHLEFSNPEKHKYIIGPIGTNASNSFIFDAKFLESQVFSSFLDMERLHSIGDKYMYK